MIVVSILVAALIVVAVGGVAYQIASAVAIWRTLGTPATTVPDPAPAVTLLKPLHGLEPRLAANLGGFVTQAYPAEAQIVFGVSDADDAALTAVAALRAAHPAAAIDTVVDSDRHGSNAKISNLVNMMGAARHDVLVMSDSDIAVTPDYLGRIVAALALPGVGAVTCLYHGRGDAGNWSRLAAQGISYGFLPSVVVGLRLGVAEPCMGSTIALTRETLDRIGGFAAFADILADDHAIGVAVRVPGLHVAVPAFTVAHGCVEPSLPALLRHETRWNVTIRKLDPVGYAGHGLVNPLPFALAATACHPAAWPLIVAAILARITVAVAVDRATRTRPGPWWWLPARDLITFGLFIAGFLVQSVDWRGSRLQVARDGSISDRGRNADA